MTKEERSLWLATLKVGDLVAIQQRGWQSYWIIAKIDRETAKTFYSRAGDFRKSDGKVVGSYSDCVSPVTEEIRSELYARKLREWFADLKSSKMDLELIRRIKAVYNKYQEDKNNAGILQTKPNP